MTLTPASFVEPVGELSADLFPLTRAEVEGQKYADEDAKVRALVKAWLDEAAQKAPDNVAAQEAWVYYRAKRAVYTRMLNAPIQADSDGEASTRYDVRQIEAFGIEAEGHRAEFARLTAPPVPASGRARRKARSTTVSNRPAW